MTSHRFSIRRSDRSRRLRFEPLEDRRLLALIADIVDVTPDPRTTSVQNVEIDFTDSVAGIGDPANGVDITDFRLTRDGEAVTLTSSMLSPSDQDFHGQYALNLAAVTTIPATYQLTLFAAGSLIKDANNNLLSADASDTWVIADAAAPQATIASVTPNPRSSAVGSVAVTFDEPVRNVDLNDFHLTRDNEVVTLTSDMLSPSDQGFHTNYTLNLASVTGTSGKYVLTLTASGSSIQDSSGNLLAADSSTTWTTDATAPTAAFAAISPNPRTTAVSSSAVTFSEPVTGVDISDFSLTRNGATVALTGVTVSGTGASYTLNNLTTVTSVAGTYVLTLNASTSGITDSNGNPLAVNASVTWVNDTTVPTATIVPISPDPRTTPVGIVTINFSEPVTGVDRGDFTLTLNGVAISLASVPFSGSGAKYTLDLTSVTQTFGNYVLTLVAAGSGIVDSAGNPLVANASDSWTIDDAGEQNDTLRTATDLGRLSGSFTFGPLGLVDANDWYRFTTTMKGGPNDSVSIIFHNSQGDLDLELYSVSGQRLRVASGVGDRETISLNGLAAGTYYIRVFGFQGAINPSYDLIINAPHPLVDDVFENNDTRSTASNLGTLNSALTISNLVMLDGHDWYRFTTTSKGISGNSVAINFQNSQGNLNLELYNAKGTRLASSSTTKNNEQISLAGRAAGTYYVHVIGVNGAHNPLYSLQINPPSTAAFNIALQVSGLKASQIAAFEQAAQKWQSIIIADLPSASYLALAPTSSIAVDDLLIDVGAAAIDGVGNIVGGSAPDAFRTDSGLPFHGIMVFDSADLASLQTSGTLLSAAEHEMAHVLGFGTIWTDKNLLIDAGTPLVPDPEFIGSHAIAAYNQVFGTAAAGVPVDDSGIEGTAGSHWRESVLGNELMTGFIGPGNVNPLSIITIASMADLGYVVNLAAADPYTKPALPAPALVLSPPLSSFASGSTTASTSRASVSRVSPPAVDALAIDWSWLAGRRKI